MNEIKLKPCPFCGSEKIYIEQYDHPAGKRWRIFCCNCMAGIDTGTDQSKGAVIETWNRRADNG